MRRAHEGYLKLPYFRRCCTALFWCWCIKEDGCCHRFFVDPKYYAEPILEDEMEGGELLAQRGLPLASSEQVAGSAYIYNEDAWVEEEEDEEDVRDEEYLVQTEETGKTGDAKDGDPEAHEHRNANVKKKRGNKKKRKKRRTTEHYTTANTLRRGTKIRKGRARDTMFVVDVVGVGIFFNAPRSLSLIAHHVTQHQHHAQAKEKKMKERELLKIEQIDEEHDDEEDATTKGEGSDRKPGKMSTVTEEQEHHKQEESEDEGHMHVPPDPFLGNLCTGCDDKCDGFIPNPFNKAICQDCECERRIHTRENLY